MRKPIITKTVIALATFLAIILIITVMPIGLLNKNIQKGNAKLADTNNSRKATEALGDYMTAEYEWRFLKYNYWFIKKLNEIKDQYTKESPIVTVFLKDEFDEQEKHELLNFISTFDSVVSVKYISKDEALTIYRERNKEEPLLTENVTRDFLPASINIYMSDLTKRQELKIQLENWTIADKVIAPENSFLDHK